MRRLPPLHALRAFEAAARHLHFARAAEELGLTPTAISHQVRQLEAILGVRLFRRSPRPISLTAEGAALYPAMRDALDRMAAAVDALPTARDSRPLAVSVTVAFASRWLMPRLPRMRRETGLEVAVEADDGPADLHGEAVDLAIRYAEIPGGGGTWIRLFEDRMLPVCHPRLVAGRAAPLDPIAIAGLPLVQYRWKTRSEAAPTWARWFVAAGLPDAAAPSVQAFSEEVHAIDAALAGQGAVLASDLLVAQALADRTLTALSPVALPGQTYWGVFLDANPRASDLLRMLNWMQGQ